MGPHTVFIAWLSYVFASRFRSTDHMQDGLAIRFLIIKLLSWGPTPFILLCCILSEQCVTTPHPQPCSLAHWGLCRGPHSPGQWCCTENWNKHIDLNTSIWNLRNSDHSWWFSFLKWAFVSVSGTHTLKTITNLTNQTTEKLGRLQDELFHHSLSLLSTLF